jgi:hypothetical protein
MSRTTRIIFHLFGAVTAVALFSASQSLASDWPTDPNTPLLVGSAQGPDDGRLSITVATDQAVWVAWQDPFCLGDLRLQRMATNGTVLAPGGLAVQPDPTCGFVIPPDLVASATGVVLGRGLADLSMSPVQRFGPDGTTTWGEGFGTASVRSLGGLLDLGGGDVLVVSTQGTTISVDRIDQDGTLTWAQTASFDNAMGPNFRILDIVSDRNGGAYIFWDGPTTYRRTVRFVRIDRWGQLVLGPIAPMLTGELDGHSRHTLPVAIADGGGGVVFIWTKGFESGTTPAPLLMQHILPDGTNAFEIEGRRVALGTARQYDPVVRIAGFGGTLAVTWRDGQGADQTVRTQLIRTQTAERLWGESGIEVAALDPMIGSFDADWSIGEQTLSLPVTGATGVAIHRVAVDGTLEPMPLQVSPSVPATGVRAVGFSDGITVVWQTATGFETALFAQRVNRGGRLGNPPCSAADFVAPFGTLNFFDVLEFLELFTSGDMAADVAGDGILDFHDIAIFLSAFSAGCP